MNQWLYLALLILLSACKQTGAWTHYLDPEASRRLEQRAQDSRRPLEAQITYELARQGIRVLRVDTGGGSIRIAVPDEDAQRLQAHPPAEWGSWAAY
ncbi:MAG: hypothetical protein NW241_09095 [Bacteroidia bacterium]|nr:hypothetical protein [Bacteroidia bacterium]